MKPLGIRLEDVDAERVRQSHHDAIAEIQRQPSANERIISSVALVDGIATLIPHGLGRAAVFVTCSPPQDCVTSGRIEEIRAGIDRTRYVSLKASGWGATITTDVAVK